MAAIPLITVAIVVPSISVISAIPVAAAAIPVDAAIAVPAAVAISLTRNLHPDGVGIGPGVYLLDEVVRVEQVEVSEGAAGLGLAEERVGVDLVGGLEDVLVVGQRLREGVDDVVDGDLLHLLVRVRLGVAHAVAAVAHLEAGVVPLAVLVGVLLRHDVRAEAVVGGVVRIGAVVAAEGPGVGNRFGLLSAVRGYRTSRNVDGVQARSIAAHEVIVFNFEERPDIVLPAAPSRDLEVGRAFPPRRGVAYVALLRRAAADVVLRVPVRLAGLVRARPEAGLLDLARPLALEAGAVGVHAADRVHD